MNRSLRLEKRAKRFSLLCGLGMVLQVGGCELGTITTTTTLDARDAIIQLIRGALITPIDAFITNAVNEALGGDE